MSSPSAVLSRPAAAAAVALCLSLGALPAAHAVSIVEYQFPGSTFVPTYVAAGVTASDANDEGSLATVEPGITAPDSLFLGIFNPATNADEAVTSEQYFQFTVAADAGYALDLHDLSFLVGKGSSAGPRGWVLRSSLDGFGSNLATEEVLSAAPAFDAFSVDLSDGFQGVRGDLTFRLYGFVPGLGQGLFFDDMVLDGLLAPVPEPATYGLFGLGLAALAFKRRRA